MPRLFVAFWVSLLLPFASADAAPPQIAPPELALWPGAVPDAAPVAGPENATGTNPGPVGGRAWTWIANVAHPTITLYPPRGHATGAALVVFPGGGYRILAVDLEGTEVCDWATSRGIACILLKYRVPGRDTDMGHRSGPYPFSPAALEDAQRAMGLVRSHAAEWHIDPHRIGIIGFSAGGHLVAALSTHFGARLYPAVDAADRESCRPDFAIALYPGHMRLRAAQEDARTFGRSVAIDTPERRGLADQGLNPDLPVTAQTPPTFLLQAQDDHVDNVGDALSYYRVLNQAGVPAELHLFAQGGHAFGLRRTEQPITRWPDLVEAWLREIGILTP